MKKPTTRTPPLPAAEAKLLQDFIHDVIARYQGPAADLESALGMYLLGRYLGWRALYVIHSKKTVAKYEEILGIEVQDAFEAEGPDVIRSAGIRATETQASFWKVVSGDITVDRNIRKRID